MRRLLRRLWRSLFVGDVNEPEYDRWDTRWEPQDAPRVAKHRPSDSWSTDPDRTTKKGTR